MSEKYICLMKRKIVSDIASLINKIK